uniref:XPGI domain-containing protein n=1 Tax=Panagrellus redivivus TaxID=6233 RepID=A0A7E4WCY5_PANRE
MGVQGLWQILEPSAQSVTLESLEGKRLAVDISIWLHQAAHGFATHGNDARKPHLVLILNRVAKLLYYKVRPVFVFDGDQIPVYKQAVLRDRQLKKAVDAITVPKQTMRVLAEVASGTTDPKKLKLAAVPDDIMALDEVDVELSEPSTSKYQPDAFLDGYTDLINRDAKIAFLADAKQRIKKTKLNDDDIPKDATDFHKFQTERILQRARINDEIEMIRNDKATQAAQLTSSQKIRTFVVDAHAGSHILTYEGTGEDQPSSSKEKISDKPLIWTEFVKQVRSQYYKEEDKKEPEEVPSSSSEPPTSKPDEFLEVWKEEESEDDDITEALLAIEGKKDTQRPQRSEKVTPADLLARKFKLPTASKLPRMAVPPDSSDSEDFEDVPLDGTGLRTVTPDANPENPQLTEDFLESNNIDEEATELNFQSSKPNENPEAEVDPRSLYGECQQLLKALGLPYVVAPSEAEAQCAELERLGLVEGSITDDSDIWLFGGCKVYKNMFSKKSREHFYNAKMIENQLGLSRFDFIELTMLAGGDYTRGFEGVGMVTALEILAEFGPRPVNMEAKVTADDAFASLESVRTWILSKAASKQKHFIESQARIRLRKAIEKSNDLDNIQDFPSRAVFDAYCEPLVSSKADPFKWNRMDFAELEEFIWEMIGWTGTTLHKKTHDALKTWDNFLSQSTQSYQTRINAFTFATDSPQKSMPLASSAGEVRTVPTSRVQAALAKLFKVKGINREPSPEVSPEKRVYAEIHAQIQASRAKGVGLNDVKSRKPRKRKAVKEPTVSKLPDTVDKLQGLSESSDSDWD